MNTITSWTSETSANKQDMHTCGWTPDEISLKERIVNILKRDVFAKDCIGSWINNEKTDTISLSDKANRIRITRKTVITLANELLQTYETNKSEAVIMCDKLQELLEKYNLRSTVVTFTYDNELGGPRYEFHILVEVWDEYTDSENRVQLMLSTYTGTTDRLQNF